jgi:hypothetical protein
VEPTTCLLCNTPYRPEPEGLDYFLFKCPNCKDYRTTAQEIVTGTLYNLTEAEKFALRCLLHRRRRPPIIMKRRFGPLADDERVITPEDAIRELPKKLADRLDNALLEAARKSERYGGWVSFGEADWLRLYCPDINEARFYFSELESRSLINDYQPFADNETMFKLSSTGWQLAEEIEEGRIGIGLRQAFIAMAFRKEGREERQQGLQKGIRDAGYIDFIVDGVEFTGKIDDRIIAEIRKCRFVVADLTYHRPNVYFEGGFAEGLGKPVIYTCHASQIKKCAFDKRQENIILWSDADDLGRRLKNRIEASIGSPA